MTTIFLILHHSILFLGSGINLKSSIKLTLVVAAEEGKNNNNINPVRNVQCRKDHANPPNLWNNSRNSGREADLCRKAGSVLKADFTNINIIGRHDSSSDINIMSCSSDIVVDGSIISDPLSGRGSQQRRENLVRDPVATLKSGGDWVFLEPGVSEGENTAELVSESDNSINNGSSSNIMDDDDYIMTTTE